MFPGAHVKPVVGFLKCKETGTPKPAQNIQWGKRTTAKRGNVHYLCCIYSQSLSAQLETVWSANSTRKKQLLVQKTHYGASTKENARCSICHFAQMALYEAI